MGEFVVSVDVGTSSARAGIYDRAGVLLARAARPIAMNRKGSLDAEHNSADVWAAVTESVNDALAASAIDRDSVDAIGFDATCSLVFLDKHGRPLTVSADREQGWDTLAWLDHRAVHEAAALTKSKLPALSYVGGIVSPEMQLPKIMWVKQHLPDVWEKTGYILDLADFLTYRATGIALRSQSTLTTKWNFLNHQTNGWDAELLAKCGLSDLCEKAGIADRPAPTGTAVGTLAEGAAAALGLPQTCKVAAGMIDAFAGALSLTGAIPDAGDAASLIGGTSSCVMRFFRAPHFIPSCWGPYYGAALDDRWIIEGGQSATGALLDHLIRTHAGLEANEEMHDRILDRIESLLAIHGADFGSDIHVLPDFHGNRSPIGDARSAGVVHGLRLDSSFDAMATVYYRAMVSLALGIRQIVEMMEAADMPIRTLHLGGGHAKNPLLAQLYADATGRTVFISSGDEAMLHGTAIAAASAAGWQPSLAAASAAMMRPARPIEADQEHARRLERDYRIFLKMQEHRRELDTLI